VLIDHRPNHLGEVGGLAGTWEQLSRIACDRPDVDLTVFFLGNTSQVLPQSPNVRYVLLPPLLGTERLPFLRGIPTHTDLAPLHPRLLRRLQGFHLLHTTDTFYAFAKTALWQTRRRHMPLVTSVHTDIIGWARIHTPAILQRLLPSRRLNNWVLERYGYLDRQERAMERRFAKYIQQCQTVFVSHQRDQERVQRLAPGTPWALLRRGLDLHTFHPRQRDRQRLAQRFGLPPEHLLGLFVGRLDAVKGVLIAAEVVRALVSQGYKIHLLVVGNGAQQQEVVRLAGHCVTLTGNLPQAELPGIYASADLLLAPSEAEVWPNVVMEARACGLPVFTCARGASHVMRGAGHDGILLPNRDPAEWLAAVTAWVAQPARLRAMGCQARRAVEAQVPSWVQVLEEDLLPVWQRSAISG
jgi:glycosyltransferase involved in cell wall biosynthesis